MASWIFAPRNASQTSKPSASAVVVIQMSIPKRATSLSHTGLLQVVGGKPAREAEVAADRLAHVAAVERARQRVHDRVRDRAVVLVAQVERRHVVEALVQHRAEQELDPAGRDAAQVRVHDRAGRSLEALGDREDGAERAALARHAVVRGDDLVHRRRAGGAPGSCWATPTPRRRPPAGVPSVEPPSELTITARLVGEVLGEARRGGAHHVADGARVVVARDADQQVGRADLAQALLDARLERRGSRARPRASAGALSAPPRAAPPRFQPSGPGEGARSGARERGREGGVDAAVGPRDEDRAGRRRASSGRSFAASPRPIDWRRPGEQRQHLAHGLALVDRPGQVVEAAAAGDAQPAPLGGLAHLAARRLTRAGRARRTRAPRASAACASGEAGEVR